MSRIRKLTDKGRELLARNMRGKCASSFRSGNAIINKLVPLLKDNTSSIEQVTEYISNLEHHKSSIVQSYSEFNEKFAGDLDTLADFHKWFNPRYDALQSVLQYSRDWVQNVHFQEGVDKDISALNVPDFQDDHDDIQPEDSASQVTPQPESGCSSNKTSRSRSSSVRSARVQESLKKVALTAQVNSLKQKQELMRKELELTMQKESLELTTNLAIATAKEEVLLDVELAKEFSVLSHDKTHQVSLHVSQSERPADTSPSVHVDHMHLSVPSNLTSTSVHPAVTVNTVRSQIDGGGPAIVVGQDVNVTSSDLSVHQSVLGQLSDAQSVSHTDPKTVTRSVPDIVSDRVSVATSHFADGMSTQLRRSDAGEFSGGSQQHSEDLGHHGVSTTPSPCHGTKMTVAFDDNVAQVHTHTDLYHSSSGFSASPVTLPTGLTSTPIDSRNGLNPASPVFIPAMRRMQANGAGDSVHCSDVVCPRSGFQEQSPGVIVMDRRPSSLHVGTDFVSESRLESVFDKLTDLMRDQRHRLPDLSVPKFSGEPLEYASFMRSFDSRVASRTNDDNERLYFLEQFTAGTPRELVRSCMMMPAHLGYVEARRKLDERYGDTFRVAQCYLKRLEKWPAISRDDTRKLDELTTFLIGCRNTMMSTESIKELDYPTSLRLIVSKLPMFLQDRWARVADKILYQQGQSITFGKLVEFLEYENRIRLNPWFGKSAVNISERKGSASWGKKKSISAAAVAAPSEKKTPALPVPSTTESPCLFCELSHSFQNCRKFRKILHKDKISFLMKHRLCFNCLGRDHVRSQCTRKATCEVCRGPHLTLLHRSQGTSGQSDVSASATISSSASPAAVSVSPSSGAPVVSSAAIQRGHGVVETMPIIPVQVRSAANGMVCKTYAFLDSGSSDTLITEALMKELGVRGKKTTISLTTLSVDDEPTQCFAVPNLEVCGLNESEFVSLPTVFTQKSMPVSVKQVPSQQDIDCWPYLSHIVVPELWSEVGILIGNNVPKATEPWEVVNSVGEGPYAVRSRLGWSVNGPLRAGSFVDGENSSVISCQLQVNSSLDSQLQKFFNLDFSDQYVFSDEKALSVEDKQFIDMVETQTVLKEGHYEICLPLRDSSVPLPNNRALAFQRLKGLKRKFRSNDVFQRKYTEFIDDLFVKGHASPVPVEDLSRDDGKVWYLPHHGVMHPRKKKLRVVLDASARFGGTSLNDQLLSGPDCSSTLIGVLVRFRQECVAFMADLQCMFYQVKVPVDQRDLLRFLWWPGGDVDQSIIECRMHAHIFGATSSPAVAKFALRKTALDNATSFSPLAVETVHRSFYVDDCLRSVYSVEEAIDLSAELRALTQKGGFRLTQWTSNSREVLNSIPESERAKNVKEVDLDHEELPSEKALGVFWRVETDTLGFQVTCLEKAASRRGVLSVVSSVYDPLGMVAPFILSGKIIVQELCRLRLGWDDQIPDEILTRWQRWLSSLLHLDSFSIPRCYLPQSFGALSSAQLHHFADASNDGYGCVSYLRLKNQAGQIHCSFVFGKGRVAPLKQLTIPRMELAAAVLAVRVEVQLQRELDLPLEQSVFWSDSTSVLGYLRNEKARFKTFVANRVAFIRENTSPSRWNFVPGHLNPADDASRGLDGEAMLRSERWRRGPRFLWDDEEEWPCQSSYHIDDNDPEVKDVPVVCASSKKQSPDILVRIMSHYSDWYKLKRFVGLFVRAVRRWKQGASGGQGDLDPQHRCLSVCDLEKAEMVIVRWSQEVHFPDVIRSLKSGCCVKDHQLAPLNPVLVDDVLRVGGRVKYAPVSESCKFPVIISPDSPIAALIIRDIHQKVGHGGRERVLARLREKWWVIHANALTRRLLKQCTYCRRKFGSTLSQQMADLPVDRVSPNLPPFTNTGIDFFGPIPVKQGRSTVKRYGALFTCLVTRAVHIEMSVSLNTDAFINTLRRFIARRGQVKVIRSDNGTNFVGAERELRRAISQWNSAQISSFLLQKDIDWRFNVPGASHHGGSWERLIRSTRRVLSGIVREQTLTDDSLTTLFAEVEAILNSRPLTRSSSDPTDLTCLSPNHLLLLRECPSLPPGVFSKEDHYVRCRWRQVQYMSDLFWKRWIREWVMYLPFLQERQKWLFPERSVQVGDVVLVVDPSAPRGSWPLGRVQAVFPDKKGLVRSVEVKTKCTTLVLNLS